MGLAGGATEASRLAGEKAGLRSTVHALQESAKEREGAMAKLERENTGLTEQLTEMQRLTSLIGLPACLFNEFSF